jgi:hypothetical protein
MQGEAALFNDIKQDDGEQSNTFTTAVAVTSESARLLRLFIGDFHPLVYHQHPGATAIVQRLGRIMVRKQHRRIVAQVVKHIYWGISPTGVQQAPGGHCNRAALGRIMVRESQEQHLSALLL